MKIYETTAQEWIKTLGPNGLRNFTWEHLRGFVDAKGFNPDLVGKLAKSGDFAGLFSHLVLRTEYEDDQLLNKYGQMLSHAMAPRTIVPYSGTDKQNSRIHAALANGGLSNSSRRFGEGASTSFRIDYNLSFPSEIRNVPIAIIGYGAAGIILTYALDQLGFENIDVYDKRRLGIWGFQNVSGLSRNNPFNLEVLDGSIEAAPGPGQEITDELENLSIIDPIDIRVASVKPGKLSHELILEDGLSRRYPIVINAAGLGKPKPVSDPDRIVTESGAQHAGVRWQMKLDPEEARDKHFVLIGLGNSTAEMLKQLHEFQDNGLNVWYDVLTHYPLSAVHNPGRYVQAGGRTYRVFRDLSRPNLVDFQGDLAQSRKDYFRALLYGNIISDVRQWEVERKGLMKVFRGKGTTAIHIKYDKILTLIGYHQGEKQMANMGCAFDRSSSCGVFDYDGEMVRSPGEPDPKKRLYKGYFGFGAITETRLDPNAIVIPGMLHHLGDLLFGIIMRAMEVRRREFLR